MRFKFFWEKPKIIMFTQGLLSGEQKFVMFRRVETSS